MLEVITYPNPLLRQISKSVEVFDKGLHTLLDEMYEVMLAKNGVGISAIQVAKPIRALLICIPDEDGNQHKEDLLEVINPKIIERDGEILFNEGCLSVPEFYEEIKRASNIKIAYQDRYGNPQEIVAQDYLAVAFQHEIDHLNGVLFIDKLSIVKRKKFEKELKQRQKH
ncbi:peptide deformylase [Helicobacter winghamensis]|uniref:Peptide deformylase n=1 Tax=Helicobacter winghamensis TaxID=157268 RepID=A0A2N3PKN0_9HELI|nr:peptide deformylase [Helicobacter winghamensis]EEO25751.1 peptide deformylase [Helicobacter winghamensis ATCC BAA-430]PKT78785.1 peptide deformylase [Helicobacter winghamensis]PKT78852.1 peptide deformylase [Helicobacter winghamensis]PKT78957.1 peptide deformylase [Helicobacter winghamensis]PKT81786.1 peptide deformylase [Helicobacter winghamensis]